MAGARILILTPSLDGRDGLSCLARQVVTALGESFPSVTLDVCVLGEAVHRETGALRVRSARGNRGRFVRWLLRHVTARDLPDAVVVLHLHLLPLALPLVWRGVPVLPFLVGIEAWRPLRGPRAMALGAVQQAAAISAHTAAEFRRANPALATLPIHVCHPAAPRLQRASSLPHAAQPFALIVGRLASSERYKGHDLLIDLWREVVSAAPDATLVIAGGGDDEGRLRARVRAAGLETAIRFTGEVDDERLAALYGGCAMFVLPSRHEGFGLVLLEAMMAERACIAGRGAPEEIVQHGLTGLIVDPDDRSGVRDAIVRLFTDRELAARLGAAGAARARETFSAARFARDLAAIVAPVMRVPFTASLC
jgi:phosphatidylinositol alpha-1,6-mannosyltransferase